MTTVARAISRQRLKSVQSELVILIQTIALPALMLLLYEPLCPLWSREVASVTPRR